MDTKQLITGSPKEGFYPIVQDTVTVIELNEAVMQLTNESSSEDIAAAFDSVQGFNDLIENVRNSENIVNGILMNNDGAIGKIICTIYAYKNQYACDIEYIYDSKVIRLDITNTNGTMSCTRKETELGGGSQNNIKYISLNNIPDGTGTVDEDIITTLNTLQDRDILIGILDESKVTIVINYYIANSKFYGYCVLPNWSNAESIVINSLIINLNTKESSWNGISIDTNGDGSKFLSDDGKYKTIEVGDKTNVLILSLENDLANGQKDSPVEAEVSTALKDAISNGKACVIKSANSDILANLQQISDNVTIVMEQISRVGQTFVAVNTTITVNTATNVISDYQTGALVLETEGDGSKFLSNNGEYKEINGIYYIDANENTPEGLEGVKTALANNKLPVFKHLYEGNPAYNLSPAICNFGSDGRLQSYMTFYDDNIIKIDVNASNELNHEQIPIKQVEKVTINAYVGSTIPIEQFEKLQVVDGIKLVLIDDPDEGYYSIPTAVKGITDKEIEYIYKGQYNKITIDNSYNVTKETKDLGGDLSNYLAKDNTTEFTPTSDYQPATKKYVDDHNSNYAGGILNIGENNVSYNEDIIDYGYLVIFLSGFGNIVIPIRVSGGEISEYKTLISVSDSVGVGESAYNLAQVAMSRLTKNANKYEGTINVKYLNRIIRESDYTDLGTTPETDDVLYFIIPD